MTPKHTNEVTNEAELAGYWHKARCQQSDNDYSVICNCHIELRKAINSLYISKARVLEMLDYITGEVDGTIAELKKDLELE